jgi:hypothetical protein
MMCEMIIVFRYYIYIYIYMSACMRALLILLEPLSKRSIFHPISRALLGVISLKSISLSRLRRGSGQSDKDSLMGLFNIKVEIVGD